MRNVMCSAMVLLVASMGLMAAESAGERPAIVKPPAEQSANGFYEKFLDCGGITVKSSGKVDNRALYRVHDLIYKLLADRPDIHKALADGGVSYVVIGATEQVTDIPEYRDMEPRAFWNERARGFGGRTTSCGEENLLNLPMDRYSDESIFIHELAHAIDGYGLRKVEPEFGKRLKGLYEAAMAKGLWKKAYAATDPAEYWAEGVQSFFDCNRQDNWNHNSINTRAELEEYDRPIADLVREMFRITDKNDWKFQPLAQQPSVMTTPAGVADEAALTKYVWCRSLPILGCQTADDEALLEVYRIVYPMFRYRHDILKAMIEAGLQVVVAADDQPRELSQALEAGSLLNAGVQKQLAGGAALRRVYVVAPQKSLAPDATAGRNEVIYQMALAAYYYTGLRLPEEKPKNRREQQQYEIGLERMDSRFDAKLTALYEQAQRDKLWSPAANSFDRFEYWAAGVCAFYHGGPVTLGDITLTSREQLHKQDPRLAELIGEIFIHPQRTDWVYQVAKMRS